METSSERTKTQGYSDLNEQKRKAIVIWKNKNARLQPCDLNEQKRKAI